MKKYKIRRYPFFLDIKVARKRRKNINTLKSDIYDGHEIIDLKSISSYKHSIRGYIDPYCCPMPFENMLLDEIEPISKYSKLHRIRYVNDIYK